MIKNRQWAETFWWTPFTFPISLLDMLIPCVDYLGYEKNFSCVGFFFQITNFISYLK